MAELISVAEADARITASIQTLTPERVTLSRAIGRLLLEPITADRDLPPFDRAMMDGIAIDSKAPGIRAGDPVNLAGMHAAGDPPPPPTPGQAWEIMTGASVPTDCDTVIPYEDLTEDQTRIVSPFKAGQYIHPTGSDARSGDVLVKAGRIVGAPEVAIAASVGVNSVSVPRLPKVGILTTGDEAIHPAAQPKAWQIRRSNGPVLGALISLFDLPINFHQHAADDAEALAERLDQALEAVDILMISGGISKGKTDHVRALVEERLGAPEFHGVAQRPGKPLAYWAGPPHVFALPGNPVSALATFARFVRPALHQLQGLAPPVRLIRAPASLAPLDHLTWLAPIALTTGRKATLHAPKNSGDFISLSPATGVAEVPTTGRFSPTAPLVYYPFAH